jgi:hypothetical protein
MGETERTHRWFQDCFLWFWRTSLDWRRCGRAQACSSILEDLLEALVLRGLLVRGRGHGDLSLDCLHLLSQTTIKGEGKRVRTIHGKERQTISSHWSSLFKNFKSETPTPYLRKRREGKRRDRGEEDKRDRGIGEGRVMEREMKASLEYGGLG